MRARAALLAALLAASGCVVLPVLGGPPPREDEATAPASLEVRSEPGGQPGSALVDLRGIVHCHSRLSHDSRGSFESIADAAAETSCSFVALTDHAKGREKIEDEPTGRTAGVLWLPGLEMNMNGGSILSVGVAAGVAHLRGLELIAAIRARGGAAIVGHAEEWRLGTLTDVDGCELMNMHADTVDENKLSLVLRGLVLPPRPFFSTFVDRDARAAAVYDALARERPLAAIGACDAHEAIRPLGPLAGAIDSYRRLFRCAVTHVLVPIDRTGEALAAADVLHALRLGRSFAACELTQDATGFRFVARDAGGVRATLGGGVTFEPGLTLEAETPVAAERLTVLRDGAPVLEVENAARARFVAGGPGVYRVEATYRGHPWIASSAIRLAPAPR